MPTAIQARRAYKRHHAGESKADSFLGVFDGARYKLGPHDAFEWEIGKTRGRYLVILKYYTWDDAWDSVFEPFHSEALARRRAKVETRKALRAFAASRREHGRAVASDVSDRLNK